MEILFKNYSKAVGIMTGTSCDGIDIAYVLFDEGNDKFLNLICSDTLPYPVEINQFVNKVLNSKIHISEISDFNFYLAEIYSDALKVFMEKHNIPQSEIDFLAVHGQTLWHSPQRTEFLTKKIASTLQAVNLSALAKLTGLPVIGDFRSGDIALGGEGAPLLPIFDRDFFGSNKKDRILLNIGGISNLTYLPKDGSNLLAFDCGPGNTLLDAFCQKEFRLAFDEGGIMARSGQLSEYLLVRLMSDNFISAAPPKSTGREKFNMSYLENILSNLNLSLSARDILRTLTEFTAESIALNIRAFCNSGSEIFVSGGGALNSFLIERLQSKFPESFFGRTEEFGIPSDGKEAIAFAYLGWLFLKGRTANIISATGASRPALLGTLAI